MTEFNVEKKMMAIECAVGSLQPSQARGNCKADAQAAIKYLTHNRLCKSGAIIHLLASDFDSSTDQLIIYASQAEGFTQVDYHDVALMDQQLIVDLGRNSGNRVFTVSDYYSLIMRLQR